MPTQLDISRPVTPFIGSLASRAEAVYGNTVVPVVGQAASCSRNLKLLPAPATFGLSSNPYGFIPIRHGLRRRRNSQAAGIVRAQHLMRLLPTGTVPADSPSWLLRILSRPEDVEDVWNYSADFPRMPPL